MKFNYARCLKIGSKCDDKFFSGIENSSFCTCDKIKCAFFSTYEFIFFVLN